MYSVIGDFPQTMANGYELEDGDVVRWQFSMYNYGDDVGADNSEWGGQKLIDADKNALTALVAEANALTKSKAFKADNPEYAEAMEVLETWDSTQDEVDEAYDALKAVMDEGGYGSVKPLDLAPEEDQSNSSSLVKEEVVEVPAFTDTASHWASEAIEFVVEKGLMNGIGGEKFDPNGTLNRAMLVTILYRLEGSPAVKGANKFSDVADGTWYTDAVIWATENGIVNGLSDELYAPLSEFTREQMATMLLRYSEYKKYDTSDANDLDKFSDAESVASWALEALQWANAEGLVNGRTETTIVPQGSATRGETATVLMRYIENIVK